MIPTPQDLEAPRASSSTIGQVLWSSAVDAFWKTILMLVMGNIALGLLGGVFSSMAPSLPPFLAGASASHANSNTSSLMHSWWSAAHKHQFAIVYLVLLAVCVRSRLLVIFPAFCGKTVTFQTSRFQKFGAQLSKDWFRLIVGNAIGALISAVVVYIVETFTGTKLLVNLLLGAILPGITAIATFIFGSAIVNFVGSMFNWYGDNQLRFNFWILYIAAVSDDLGIPNIKTLARLLWVRWRRHNSSIQAAT